MTLDQESGLDNSGPNVDDKETLDLEEVAKTSYDTVARLGNDQFQKFGPEVVITEEVAKPGEAAGRRQETLQMKVKNGPNRGTLIVLERNHHDKSDDGQLRDITIRLPHLAQSSGYGLFEYKGTDRSLKMVALGSGADGRRLDTPPGKANEIADLLEDLEPAYPKAS